MSIIGACFTNNTGRTLNSFSISYTGEQYRLGATGRSDRLDFQYSLNATSLNSGTYIDFNALDFNSPTTTGTTGVLNGNSNSTDFPATMITPAGGIPSGATIYIRFVSVDISGSDDALAIDNFTFTTTIPTAASVNVSGRVMTANGRGIRNVLVRLTDEHGQNRTAMTTTFGYYRFVDIPAGQTYTISVAAKRYTFNQPAQVLSLAGDADGINFVAQD